MVNPLEIRVALNATTHQGLSAYQELAGVQYRQLQDLKDTHKEALTRPSRVEEAQEDQAARFERVENPGEESARKQELFERHRERQRKSDEFVGYGPRDRRQKSLLAPVHSGRTGQNLDLIG